MASRGYWGQTITRAWEGHLGGEKSGDLSVDELICMNGIICYWRVPQFLCLWHGVAALSPDSRMESMEG